LASGKLDGSQLDLTEEVGVKRALSSVLSLNPEGNPSQPFRQRFES
jgi:hypothetical protein